MRCGLFRALESPFRKTGSGRAGGVSPLSSRAGQGADAPRSRFPGIGHREWDLKQTESRWHSDVGHGAIDVVVAGRGEVQRDRRFLEGDHAAGGDVEAAADAVAVAAAGASQAAEGLVQEEIRLVEGRGAAAPTNMPPPEPLPPLAPEPPLPPWATFEISKLLLRLTDDVSEAPPMATAMAPPMPSPPLAPAPPAPPWARLPRTRCW